MLIITYSASAYDAKVDGIYYNLNENERTAEVTYCKKKSSDNESAYIGAISIPSNFVYDGIEYTVTSIGENAFYLCSSLTSIAIPNSVTIIGNNAFAACIGLNSVTISNSVTSIGNAAFCYCRGLTSIIIPNSVTDIGANAFRDCTKLNSATIGNSVTVIGVNAFEGTAWLNNKPDGLVYIGKVLYKYKGNMPDNTSISIKDGTLSITGSALFGFSGLTSIIIPNSVTSIGDAAFKGCSRLNPATIGTSVTSIGRGAFCDCIRLKEVHIYDLAAWCKIDFYDDNSNPLYYAHSLYLNGELITDLMIPNSVTSIGMYAFKGCTSLTSATIPNSVNSIDNGAFADCQSLIST